MASMIFSTVLAAAAVSLLIVVHELGHFLAARAMGVRVEVFSLGFLTKIVSFTRKGTEYRLSLIPFGGYVKLAGENPGEQTGKADELWSKTPAQRALIFGAGVALNAILAVVAFVIAFAIGVPFPVAEVGGLRSGEAAWEAGLQRGDRIVEIDGLRDPDLQDISRRVALGGGRLVRLKVRRGEKTLDFHFKPRYSEELGRMWLGFAPPYVPLVNGLAQIGEGTGARSPAQEAGIRPGDRIVALNGRPVETVTDLLDMLEDYPNDDVKVAVLRGAHRFEVTVRTEPLPDYAIGISCVSSTIRALQKGAMAQRVGFRKGDTITSVNEQQVRSVVEVEDIIRRSYGEVSFSIIRKEEPLELRCNIPDAATLREFLSSVQFEADTVLQWVQEGSPAWRAGMRPGDTVVSVAGDEVESWKEILTTGAKKGTKPRAFTWRRDGKLFTATVTPALDTRNPVGALGVIFDEPKMTVKRYGIVRAVKNGIYKTYGTVMDILLTLRGVATGQVSARKNLGGVVAIAYISYRAARQGPAKLLYWMGVISACLAFMNILPIPVLDGGHLMFVAIEKLRGKPVSEKAMAVSMYVGMALLLTLVLYVTWNDLARLFF